MGGGRGSGFGVLQVLAVCLILGLVAAVVVTAVGGSRESARQAACLNKMREVATAIAQFESDHNFYPGWRHNPYHGRDAETGRPITFSTSWFAAVLPYIGRNDVIDPDRQGSLTYPHVIGGTPRYEAPPMPWLLVCPADTEKMASKQAEMSYVGNAGREDAPATAAVPADWPANGVFLNLLPWRNDPVIRVMSFRIGSDDIRGGDGLSTTLLLSENLDAGQWHQIDEAASGFVFYPPSRHPRHRINGPGAPRPPAYLSARPSSNHAGGVNVIFAGGNGRFVRESMDYQVYCALMTPNGRSAKEPGSTQPSPEAITNPPKLTVDSY